MRANDKGTIRFKFKYGVEFVEKGAKIMVREGNTKAFGQIVDVYPINAPPEDLVDNFTVNDSRVGLLALGAQHQAEKKRIHLFPVLPQNLPFASGTAARDRIGRRDD